MTSGVCDECRAGTSCFRCEAAFTSSCTCGKLVCGAHSIERSHLGGIDPHTYTYYTTICGACLEAEHAAREARLAYGNRLAEVGDPYERFVRAMCHFADQSNRKAPTNQTLFNLVAPLVPEIFSKGADRITYYSVPWDSIAVGNWLASQARGVVEADTTFQELRMKKRFGKWKEDYVGPVQTWVLSYTLLRGTGGWFDTLLLADGRVIRGKTSGSSRDQKGLRAVPHIEELSQYAIAAMGRRLGLVGPGDP